MAGIDDNQVNLTDVSGLLVSADNAGGSASRIAGLKLNLSASAVPTGSDSFASGYAVGSRWVWGSREWLCYGDGLWVEWAKESDLASHELDIGNPHGVTAGQVGSYTEADTNTLLDGKVDLGPSTLPLNSMPRANSSGALIESGLTLDAGIFSMAAEMSFRTTTDNAVQFYANNTLIARMYTDKMTVRRCLKLENSPLAANSDYYIGVVYGSRFRANIATGGRYTWCANGSPKMVLSDAGKLGLGLGFTTLPDAMIQSRSSSQKQLKLEYSGTQYTEFLTKSTGETEVTTNGVSSFAWDEEKFAVNGNAPVAKAAAIADPTGTTELETSVAAIIDALEDFGILST